MLWSERDISKLEKCLKKHPLNPEFGTLLDLRYMFYGLAGSVPYAGEMRHALGKTTNAVLLEAVCVSQKYIQRA